MVGGVINCDFNEDEWYSTITGGSYTINNDYSGYVTITTKASDDGVCDGDHGVDLTISIVGKEPKVFFATDGSDNYYDTGEFKPFNGDMEPIY